MLQFAEQYTEWEIVVSLSRQLSWSHLIVLLPLKKQEAKLYYAEKVASEMWGVRTLRKQIGLKAFERAIITNSNMQLDKLPAENIFKDPYFLDFLGLTDDFLEKDLEEAILHELEKFILELGKGFTFVERQKRMIFDGDDFGRVLD